MKYIYPPGATPLDQDEIAGLIPLHIKTQGELNEWEAQNILKAETWLYERANNEDFLTSDFTKLLHEKMFDDTWKWAGKFRSSEKSIGVAPYYITTQLSNLLKDIEYQLLNLKNPEDKILDEIALKFHHRLVAIHPFPNGNGRHSRLMADFLLIQMGRPRFSWGKENLVSNNAARNQYIDALRKADAHDYRALNDFVRS